VSESAKAQVIDWKGNEATRLENGMIELIVRNAGGHLAEMRFLPSSGAGPDVNVMWEASWSGVRRADLTPELLLETNGLTGHGLCLDYFGWASPGDRAAGNQIHGEAPAQHWRLNPPLDPQQPGARWETVLPHVQLGFSRRIRLGEDESVAYIEEQVVNLRSKEHVFGWVQHATFGPPFATASETTFSASGAQGLTSEDAYAGCSRVQLGRQFQWPLAPSENGTGTTDLRLLFTEKGRGLFAAVQLDPAREIEYVVGVNWKLGLGVGYCFRRKDFPWMGVWEENCSRDGSPWNGNSQARGMEFGTTPFPTGRDGLERKKPIFETPTWCTVSGNGRKIAKYLLFVFAVPPGMQSVENVEVAADAIVLSSENRKVVLSVPAKGAGAFLNSRDNAPS
jgi:hypothetical protein